MKYAIRIPANDILQRDIEELLKRPVGRPTKKPLVEYKGFLYQGSRLEDGSKGGGESRASFRGVVLARGVHCNESDAAESGGGAVL